MREASSMKDIKKIRIALVHDYLREYGGAERVLEALHEMFPDAPVYVAFKDESVMGVQWERYKNWDIRESWMAKLPLIKKLFSPLRFLAPKAFADLDLSEFDVVISSTNAYFSKAIKVPNGKHLCYCHTPARSLYGYQTMTDWKKNPIIRIGGELINHYLRMADFSIAQKVDVFIANSRETQQRIKKFYRRESEIVYPPIIWSLGHSVTGVKIQKTQRPRDPEKYWLFLSRLAYSKNPQLAVEWATKTNSQLVVAGEGKMKAQLEKIAGSTVKFVGFVPDEEIDELYANALGLIYPVTDEDFGMVPVEAMMHGIPVIAHNSGGPKETVIDGKTGVLFDELTIDGLATAVSKAQEHTWQKEDIQKYAKQFSAEEFRRKILRLVVES